MIIDDRDRIYLDRFVNDCSIGGVGHNIDDLQ